MAPQTETPCQRTVLIVPALGVPAKHYERLADALTGPDTDVQTHDPRYSSPKNRNVGRNVNFGYVHLENDLRGDVAAIRSRTPDRELVIIGHSLGGHVAALLLAHEPHLTDRLALVASSSPYRRHYRGATAAGIALLGALVPAVSTVLGYWPGDRLGFGGRQPRTLMREWARVARTGGGWPVVPTGTVDHVMSLAIEADTFAPAEAQRALTAALLGHDQRPEIVPQSDFDDRVDHFTWLRDPGPVADRLRQFIEVSKPVCEAAA